MSRIHAGSAQRYSISVNIGMILRTYEVFGFAVIVHDINQLFADEAKVEVLRDFACGAYQRHPPLILDRQHPGDSPRQGRLVA